MDLTQSSEYREILCKYCIYFMINTTIPVTHPIHLYGHDFYILAQGTGLFNGSVITKNPPRRDTAVLPPSGWHINMGLALQFIELQEEIRRLIDYGSFEKELRCMGSIWYTERYCRNWYRGLASGRTLSLLVQGHVFRLTVLIPLLFHKLYWEVRYHDGKSSSHSSCWMTCLQIFGFESPYIKKPPTSHPVTAHIEIFCYQFPFDPVYPVSLSSVTNSNESIPASLPPHRRPPNHRSQVRGDPDVYSQSTYTSIAQQ